MEVRISHVVYAHKDEILTRGRRKSHTKRLRNSQTIFYELPLVDQIKETRWNETCSKHNSCKKIINIPFLGHVLDALKFKKELTW